MKWLIASDLHGSAYYTQKLMQAFETEQADRFLLLGDLLYHGPRNDLPRDYAPKEVIAMLNTRKESILCVRGNCDTEVDQMVLSSTDVSECFAFAKNDCEKYHPAAQTANRCFQRKSAADFVIFPEIMLDNGGGVWYHTFVR